LAGVPRRFFHAPGEPFNYIAGNNLEAGAHGWYPTGLGGLDLTTILID
jgi:hypothetical protein